MGKQSHLTSPIDKLGSSDQNYPSLKDYQKSMTKKPSSKKSIESFERGRGRIEAGPRKTGRIDTFYMGMDRKRMAEAKFGKLRQVQVGEFNPGHILKLKEVIEQSHAVMDKEEHVKAALKEKSFEEKVSTSAAAIKETGEAMTDKERANERQDEEENPSEKIPQAVKLNRAMEFFEDKRGHILSILNPEFVYGRLVKRMTCESGRPIATPEESKYFLMQEADFKDLKKVMEMLGFNVDKLKGGKKDYGFVADDGKSCLAFLFAKGKEKPAPGETDLDAEVPDEEDGNNDEDKDELPLAA